MNQNLNVLLVGYGAMGRAVDAQLTTRGHRVVDRISSAGHTTLADALAATDCDIAIEFSVPQAAATNVGTLLESQVPVVSGTTGWQPELLGPLAEQYQTPFLHAANFSIGIAVMKRLAAQASEVLRNFREFEPAILERHHNRKLDAPSGTARMLAETVRDTGDYDDVQIGAVRQGGIAGEHTLFFEGEAESLELTHRAHSREIFAIGAVRAAEWVVQARPPGLVTFDTFLERNSSWTAAV